MRFPLQISPSFSRSTRGIIQIQTTITKTEGRLNIMVNTVPQAT